MGNDSIVVKNLAPGVWWWGGGKQKYFQFVHTYTHCTVTFKPLLNHCLWCVCVCVMNPFIFSTHVRTHTNTWNVNIPFGVFLNFKSPAPFLSFSLSLSLSRSLTHFNIAPGMRACVRWLVGVHQIFFFFFFSFFLPIPKPLEIVFSSFTGFHISPLNLS